MAERYGFTADTKTQEREARKAQREARKSERVERARARNAEHSNNARTFDIIKGVLCLMLIMVLADLFTDNDRYVSLDAILDFLSSIPTFDFQNVADWFRNLAITADWGFFNFLRDFFNLASGALSFFVFMSQVLLNCVVYLITVLYWLLYGVQITFPVG